MGIECPRIVFRRALEAFWAIEHVREYAASGDLPYRSRLQAIIIVWIQRFDPGSATTVAVAARASTPRPDRQFGFMRLDQPRTRSWVGGAVDGCHRVSRKGSAVAA